MQTLRNEWSCVFFIVLCPQSSVVLRQSLGKLFAVCHHRKVFGKTMWDFSTHVLLASFVRKLAKEGAVSQVTAPHHTPDGRFSVISVFKLSPQLEFFPSPSSHTPFLFAMSSSVGLQYLVGLPLEMIVHWEAWPRPCVTDSAGEGVGCFV